MKTFSGRAWSQRIDELKAFIALLRRHQVRRYLEIGARDGDTFHAVMTALPVGSTGVAVDMPGGAWGRYDSRLNLERAMDDLRSSGYRVSSIFGDSHTDATLALVVGRGPYDAVLIDADHGYEGVARDWALYGPLAPLVAFHDIDGAGIVQRTTGQLVEVPKLWEAIKSSHKHLEIIGRERGMGIGVVLKSDADNVL